MLHGVTGGFPKKWNLDSIQFSDLAVPEPSVLACLPQACCSFAGSSGPEKGDGVPLTARTAASEKYGAACAPVTKAIAISAAGHGAFVYRNSSTVKPLPSMMLSVPMGTGLPPCMATIAVGHWRAAISDGCLSG